ncbi:MAG: signal peptidase I [Pseudobdellovibrio sp.]
MSHKNTPTLLWILGAIVLAITVRVLFLGVFKVPTVTMTPTLVEGDIILANKLAYQYQNKKPEYGDVVVFSRPQKMGQYFIKRVVALPGDTIAIKNGVLYLNKKPCIYEKIKDLENFVVMEELCNQSIRRVLLATSGELKSKDLAEITVGSDEYYVLGDNRDTSDDSRDWGPIKFDQVASKATYVWISVGSTQDSISQEKGFRFSRFLTKIK